MIIGAFAVVYFVWGSTYLANAWAVRSIPPFLLAGLRFFFAGLLMLLVGLALKQAKVTARQWRNAFIAGFLLFVVGNGALVWSLQYIDSGIVALVVAFEPLLVVLLQWKMRGRRPTIDTLIGIFLGVIGMGLLVGQPTFLADPNWLVGLGAIFLGMLAWAYVSVWIPTADLPNSNFQSAALQMLSGGVLLLVISVFTGDIARFDWTQVSERSIRSFIYLILGGSILAFTSFNYLLKNVATEKVVTNTYVNPVVALFLGWWLNHEQVSSQSVFASVLLLGGVVLTNTKINWKWDWR